MTIQEFESKMKEIVQKASDMCGRNLIGNMIISGDPDFVADIGCDYKGNLIYDRTTLPVKIRNITGIRYRFNRENREECFIRFDFGENFCLDCCYEHSFTGDYFVKWCDKYLEFNGIDEVCEFFKDLINSIKNQHSELS